MRRIAAVGFGLVLVILYTSVSLAAPPQAGVYQIALSAATTDVSASCVEGAASPCPGTVRMAFSGTISGAPFANLRGIKGPQTVVGTIDIPMATYDATTHCFTGASGRLQLRVPQGKHTQLAFEVVLGTGAGCNGSGTGTFQVDSSQSEVKTFQNSVGTGTFLVSSNLNVEAQTVSALQINLTGSMVLAH